MRVLLVTSLVCMLLMTAGCGAGRDVYHHPDLNAQDEERDYNNCLFEAQKSTGNLSDSDDREDRIEEMVDSCMRSKGYTP